MPTRAWVVSSFPAQKDPKMAALYFLALALAAFCFLLATWTGNMALTSLGLALLTVEPLVAAYHHL